MLKSRLSKIVFFLIIPVLIAGLSFVYNFANVLFSPGDLTKGHAEYQESCFDCHAILTGMSGACLDCHEVMDKNIEAGYGFHAVMKEEDRKNCMNCHNDHKGRDYLIISDFRKNDELTELVKSVLSAKKPPFNHIPEKLNEKYENLWKSYKPENFVWNEDAKKSLSEGFEHSLTGYTLVGKHAEEKCEKCHKDIKKFEPGEKSGIFPGFTLKDLKRDQFCFSCHEENDKDKKGHKGKFGKKCGDCHSIGGGKDGWKVLVPKIRDHHKKKDHELHGRHKKTKCVKCHTETPFKKDKEEQRCIACHKKEDKKIHEKSLGDKCENCHTPISFRKEIFDHQKTSFILYYSHKKAKCGACHKEWNDGKGKKKIYKKIQNFSCFVCHSEDDVHRGAFKKDCARCHRETYWADVIER